MMNKHLLRRNFLYRWYMKGKALLAWRSFGTPGTDISFLGITGTDGKSTTSYMLYTLLKQAGMKVGIISTVYIDVGDGLEDNTTHMTSLDHKVFWRCISQAEKNGCTHVVVEVSSHALYQYRTWPITFSGVACTNLSREHLDFHGTMEHYAKTKAELFSHVKEGALGVLPSDFAYTSFFSSRHLQIKTFGHTELADIYVDMLTEDETLCFDLHISQERLKVKTKIVGAFNADNMMVASLLAQHAGVCLEDIQMGLSMFSGLPGRQECVHTKEGITAMIDFAVTADGLRTLYGAIQQMGYKKIIAVFGATGNRDQGKRPDMGAVAGGLCDKVIITEDENYHEDGMQIMKQVEAGIISTGCAYELVQDRTDAIYRGLELAAPGDIVVVTGMANYTTRAMNEGSIPWNERAVIEDQMKNIGYTVL